MKSFIRFFLLLIIIILFSFQQVDAQTKTVYTKPPKFTLTFALSYNYPLSRAFGDLGNCTIVREATNNNYIFTGKNYGMLQGGSVMVDGKLAVDKYRKIRLTLNLGYSLFYNSAFDGINKNQWHLFSGAFGLEYNFAPKARYRPYIGYELVYTLMFGSWQYGVTEPNGDITKIYEKFKPANRFGMAFNSGVEYMINKKVGVTFGGRIVWANIAPKMNKASGDPYTAYINDAKDDNGINIGFRKQIVYFQFIGGVSMFIHRK